MPAITLRAHYDGKQIVLDEPFDLPAHALLSVTILSDEAAERNDWLAIGLEGLAGAYGGDEPEYTLADRLQSAITKCRIFRLR